MRIVDADISDPRQRGSLCDPVLELKVDEPVYEQEEPVTYKSQPLYRVIPCGPFYAVEYLTGRDEWSDIGDGNSGDIGEFNTLGLLKDQLVPVKICTPEDVLDLYMIVPRARRLLRKYGLAFEWHITVDEQAALFGSLKWRVELRSPVCYGGAVPFQARCYAEPTHTIIQQETHLTLCSRHLRDHEDRMRAARKKSATS